MAIEISSDKNICPKCGTAYTRRKGFFLVSYAELYKGIGYMGICKNCVDQMYMRYLPQSGGDSKKAVRQICRKLDIYWNDDIYESVAKKSSTRSVMTQYMSKLNTVSTAGKSYDDTLIEEGTLWSFGANSATDADNAGAGQLTEVDSEQIDGLNGNYEDEVESPDTSSITDDVIAFWGKGYTDSMYLDLEQRRSYYMSKLPSGEELDVGSEALIRQICNLEVSIARDSAAGKSIDKSVNSLNTLLGSLNLKPTQKKDSESDEELAKTPLGVWLYKYENKRPLPEIDEQLKDVNNLKKYIFTWMGHLCKMMGVKSGYTKLYEKEVERLRVERPEFDDEDDEDFLNNVYSDGEFGDDDYEG